MKVFLAGATGAIGRPLCRLLREAGHTVAGTTRRPERAAELAALGIAPVVVDVFDADRLKDAVVRAQPDVVIHQLTDLPQEPDPAKIAAALAANARLRIEGTRNLIAGARAAGVRRVIAQSIAFAYAPGEGPRQEPDPLATSPDGTYSPTVEGVIALETAVTCTPDVVGNVLRYGRLYGPGTWTPTPQGGAPLHVDAAAHAALLALTRGEGVYNIAEDDGTVAIGKARRELGFDPAFRLPA